MLQPLRSSISGCRQQGDCAYDASSDARWRSPPGEGLISGALPLMKAKVRPATFRIAVAIRSGIMPRRAHELKCVCDLMIPSFVRSDAERNIPHLQHPDLPLVRWWRYCCHYHRSGTAQRKRCRSPCFCTPRKWCRTACRSVFPVIRRVTTNPWHTCRSAS
ncbi:Uncharacterised protein [Escherichia coli]|nr:Uncharacterised protein [Escherichia coli]